MTSVPTGLQLRSRAVCHFFVYNEGRTPARNAQARLMCVDRLTEFGEPRPETGFTAPRTLKWANEVDFNTRDILINEIERGLNSHQHGSECRPLP